MILFSRFYSELHSLGTIIVDVNSIAAAAMSDACTVSTAMASRLFYSIWLGHTSIFHCLKQDFALIDLECVFASILVFLVVKS